MERRFHRGFTAAEKTELWDRWKRGESLKGIAATDTIDASVSRSRFIALHIRNTAHPLAVLEHRGFWHARRPSGAFRITLKHPTAQAASVGTLRTAARNIARPKT
jgi:hypothetical protein